MPTSGNNIKFKQGLQQNFNSATKDADTIYFTTDTHRIYVGNEKYAADVPVGNVLPVTSTLNDMFILQTSNTYSLYISDGTNWHSLSELSNQQFTALRQELEATATNLTTTYETSMQNLSTQYTTELNTMLASAQAAINQVQLVTGPFYIQDEKNNKNYACNLKINSSGEPIMQYEEIVGE